MSAVEQHLQHFSPFAGESGSCSLTEYRTLLERLVGRVPCHFLVFGCGRDSRGWGEVNAGGRTVFLESEQVWIDRAREESPSAEIVKVSYTAPRPRWRILVEDNLHRELDPQLALELPSWVREIRWEAIFVDAPLGLARGPGRHSSIYTARGLVKEGGLLAVHDCDRVMERTLCDLLLEDRRLSAEVEKLRIYEL